MGGVEWDGNEDESRLDTRKITFQGTPRPRLVPRTACVGNGLAGCSGRLGRPAPLGDTRHWPHVPAIRGERTLTEAFCPFGGGHFEAKDGC